MNARYMRSEIRDLIEVTHTSGRHPLRKREVHRAYYCLTGEKLGNVSVGQLHYELLNEIGFEIDPWDANRPLRKAELTALYEELQAQQH